MSLSIDYEVSKSTISPKILVTFYTHFTHKWLYHSCFIFSRPMGPYTNNMILSTNTYSIKICYINILCHIQLNKVLAHQ